MDVKVIGCGCSISSYGTQKNRGFPAVEERIELLEAYKNDLEKEAKGVSERIKELERRIKTVYTFFVC